MLTPWALLHYLKEHLAKFSHSSSRDRLLHIANAIANIAGSRSQLLRYPLEKLAAECGLGAASLMSLAIGGVVGWYSAVHIARSRVANCAGSARGSRSPGAPLDYHHRQGYVSGYRPALLGSV